MKRIFGAALLLTMTFGAGYLVASWRWFAHPDSYELRKPVAVRVSGSEQGVLPRGSKLYYQSSAHGSVDFYVLVRLPIEEAKVNLKKVDTEVSRLTGTFDPDA